ncbi:MAG: enoyl-CoA hydratase/isomerase family protein [Dehalococcoidia bacterium]|nr:enoyl-CoA hydratase/isomerase family protein [Dehalococcoidia bacterium]
MEYKHIIFEKKNGVGKITLNRPEVFNALHPNTHTEIRAALKDIEEDEGIRVAIITGTGRAFSAGADLGYIKTILDSPKKIAAYGQIFHDTNAIIESMAKPVIAVINGLCLAGATELMEACDIAIADEAAPIGDGHAVYGLVPGGGSTQRLPRLIPRRKAKELLLTGDSITCREAEALGLINKAVPADKLEEAVNEMTQKLMERSPMASKFIKYAVNRGLEVDLYTGVEIEKGAASAHVNTEDFKEGITAFNEKRKPVFPGR